MFEDDNEGFVHYEIKVSLSLPKISAFVTPCKTLSLTLEAISGQLRKMTDMFELICVARATDIQPNGREEPSDEMQTVRKELETFWELADHIMAHCQNHIFEAKMAATEGHEHDN